MPDNIQKELNHIVDLLSAFEPVSRIFLFGSYARQTQAHDSDFDLCILTNDHTKRRIDLAAQAEMLLYNKTNMPTDIVVMYEDDFLKQSNISGTLEAEVAREGVLLYG